MNKKAFQMSVSVLVVIILGIVILVAGIKVVTDVFDKADDINEGFTEQQISQLEKTMFADGKQIALLTPTKTINKGDTTSFTIGMRNTIGTPETFYVTVKDSGHSEDASGNTLSETASLAFLMPKQGPAIIQTTEKTLQPSATNFEKIHFIADKDTPRGTYVYDAYICYKKNPVDPETQGGCDSGYTWYTGTKLRFTVYVK